jgi:hypothetical protein
LQGIFQTGARWYNSGMENTIITEADIREEMVGLLPTDMSPDTARQFLKLRFKAETTRIIRKLLRQYNRGTITAEDRILLERYLNVGRFIDLLQARAHLALRKNHADD